jgi:hypothetical protein
MRDRNQARPGDFPIGSVQSRAAARALFGERVSDDVVMDMSGLPSPFPTSLAEYVDCGCYIAHEVTCTNEGKRTIFRRTIRKDSEEYQKALAQGHD